MRKVIWVLMALIANGAAMAAEIPAMCTNGTFVSSKLACNVLSNNNSTANLVINNASTSQSVQVEANSCIAVYSYAYDGQSSCQNGSTMQQYCLSATPQFTQSLKLDGSSSKLLDSLRNAGISVEQTTHSCVSGKFN